MTALLLLPVFSALLLIALCLVMLRRNNQVHQFRTALSNRIYEANMVSTNAVEFSPGWERRLEEARVVSMRRNEWYESVTYAEMANKFWKPLDSFYGPMPGDEQEEWPDEIEV